MSNTSLLSSPQFFSRALVDCPSGILDSDVSGPSAGGLYFNPSWFVYLLHGK
jgi:hypothetical protein